jgi:micrococcal nuclease
MPALERRLMAASTAAEDRKGGRVPFGKPPRGPQRPATRRTTTVISATVWLGFASGMLGGCPTDDQKNNTPSPCGPGEGVVTRVLDGDTVDLESGVRIRYLLMDTPEIAHNTSEATCCFGDEARLLNESLVLNQTVTLEYDQECQDRYGRTLAYVSVGGRMVNRLMVERGFARVEIIPPNGRYAADFEALEQSAKDANAGLWGACSAQACPMGAFK